MSVIKEKVKSQIAEFANKHSILFGIFIVLIFFACAFIIIALLESGAKIGGLEYNTERLAGIATSLILLSIIWLAIYKSSKKPNSLFHSNKKNRFKIHLFFLIFILALLSAPFVNIYIIIAEAWLGVILFSILIR